MTRALLGIVADGTGNRGLTQQICEACVNGLDVDGAALSLLTASVSRETLWATDATAELLEDLQFTLNEGPCMQAAVTGTPVLVPDLQHSTETARWPVFAAAAADQTLVGALFALPLQWGGSTSESSTSTGPPPGNSASPSGATRSPQPTRQR